MREGIVALAYITHTPISEIEKMPVSKFRNYLDTAVDFYTENVIGK